jgi:SAM-dependent methyltransferase
MKRSAPAALRNREPILEVLRQVLPASGLVLEVASGTGQHVVHFARALPALEWQPTDQSEAALASIEAWREEAGLSNVRPPLQLDVTETHWPVERAEAVISINLIHIAPWSACLGLLAGAGRILPPGGPLVLYGPYFREGVETAPSNLAFDAGLRAQDPAWGLRSLEEVAQAARSHGLSLERVVELPANNLAVVFRR